MLPFGCENLRELVKKWNSLFPLDRWYREKYNIPFNSEKHRQLSMIDMFFEYYEWYLYHYKPKVDKENRREDNKEPYIKGTGNFMKKHVLSQSDIDKMFNELDIDKM